MQHIRFFLWLLLPVLVIGACGKDEPCNDPTNFVCPNYDICTTVLAANSDFVIIDSVRWADTLLSFPTDTSHSLSGIYFKPTVISDQVSYEWKIGTDARIFTRPVETLDFSGYEGNLTVRLVTKITDRYGCLEPSELTDTTYQSVYIRDIHASETPIWGEFKGRNLGEDGAEYTILADSTSIGWIEPYRVYGLRLPGDCSISEVGIPVGSGYTWFVSDFKYFSGNLRCRKLITIGRLNPNNRDELRIDYWYDGDDGKRIHRTFVGLRQ